MAYSDFTTLRKVQQLLGVNHQLKPLFVPPITEIQASDHLLFDLAEAEILAPTTEKSKSELIIAPILKEVRRKNAHKIAYFSGFSFDVDAEKQLVGVCDFIFGNTPQTLEINTPIFCVIEAKNRTIEEGFGQCVAEMIAAQLYNAQDGKNIPVIYGAVTNGLDWAFLSLQEAQATIDTNRYSILKLSELLGVFQIVIDRI